MFSSLLRRSTSGSRRVSRRDQSPHGPRQRLATADFSHVDDFDDDDDDDDGDDNADQDDDQDANEANAQRPHDDEDGSRKTPALLPLFSATHLDALPIYTMTHAIRIIVSTRTETSLTWEQLRSPQVSQFLIKPMQQQIRTLHFSRATLYALMANCLQFTKEGQRYAANAGTCSTRAKVCQLLALKLLKEYTTRELIDALAYDFYPLQGIPGADSPLLTGAGLSKARMAMTASRTSTLEVAIRASAKHFLAHPVVVQQLEAIWNGAITFYSSADCLHRQSFAASNTRPKLNSATPLLASLPPKPDSCHPPPGTRTVMLYDPRQASLLKLSRLRVPRYRFFLSTLSLAVLIGLFLAVLSQRSVQITGLELIFWFWSAGFMLDELVGFNEQGFALYIMSFWNIFDLGILVLLIAYYCMRAYGVFVVDPHHWNAMAYDVLAANAILLLPRIFSVLDHYQYFSQLLIAFRLMAVDLAAVFVLVLIMCSGFYVFFTLSESANNGDDVAYKIFQILMGFTPAAWDVWPQYNWLARLLMMMFLIICHFLIVTILITVLTNSFMTIASNATEEHQFVFAINTISMVKNDALFSYIAPSNIFAWLLMPLRYCMPLKHFVWLNRTIIKVTHFPVLFSICLYERFWLAPSMYEPTDLIENGGRLRRPKSVSFRDPSDRAAMFSPNVRVREESVVGLHKDRALEEVFRRVPEATTLRTHRRNERRKTQKAIRNWMDQNDEVGVPLTHWPTLDSRAVPEWQRRLSAAWERSSYPRQVSDLRSTASDPADFASTHGASFSKRPGPRVHESRAEQTDADGDDELVTNDDDEDDIGSNGGESNQYERHGVEDDDYFTTPVVSHLAKRMEPSRFHGTRQPVARKQNGHGRTLSTSTILYKPDEVARQNSSESSKAYAQAATEAWKNGLDEHNGANFPNQTARAGSPQGPMSTSRPALAPRPMAVPRGLAETGGVSRTAMLSLDPRDRLRSGRRLSSVDMSILSDNMGAEDQNTGLAGSFQTQMAMAMMKDNRLRVAGGMDVADRDRMGRLILARMKTLEESFAEVISEMRQVKRGSTTLHSSPDSPVDNVARGTTDGSSGGHEFARKAKSQGTAWKEAARRGGSRRDRKQAKADMSDEAEDKNPSQVKDSQTRPVPRSSADLEA
ncbi:hypothetical protein CDD81_1173 [Ophiocordyceps australis]|uniref:Uncharacterized protein n=1 Tax=Ophiocordyceps australis TaxID=1399860 RepID=A0A2C5XZC9_9HYPO|nr:hypothetical protein CDD81_1173 [Ophiocordyceps australis]